MAFREDLVAKGFAVHPHPAPRKRHKRSHSPTSMESQRNLMIDAQKTLEDVAIVMRHYGKLIDELEDRVDVDDGPNGEPTPNYAMSLLRDQDKGRAALKRLGWPKKGGE